MLYCIEMTGRLVKSLAEVCEWHCKLLVMSVFMCAKFTRYTAFSCRTVSKYWKFSWKVKCYSEIAVVQHMKFMWKYPDYVSFSSILRKKLLHLQSFTGHRIWLANGWASASTKPYQKEDYLTWCNLFPGTILRN